MSKAIDLKGQRFGSLVVVASAGSYGNGRLWTCRCECGGQRTALASELRCGRARNCGCSSHGDNKQLALGRVHSQEFFTKRRQLTEIESAYEVAMFDRPV